MATTMDETVDIGHLENNLESSENVHPRHADSLKSVLNSNSREMDTNIKIVLKEEDSDTGAQDQEEATVPCSESSQEKVEALFRPPLYQQRYSLVLELLEREGVTRVIDMGCNNGRFLGLLRGLPGATYLVGLDLDVGLLEGEARCLRPLPLDWVHRREAPLTMELRAGSCGDREGAGVLKGRGLEAVTSIELVEHLDPSTLATFPATVLGELRPLLWVVTTPNQEYNTLFPDFPGPFRHWDHR